MFHSLYLENAKTGKNNWWRYLFTLLGSLGLASIAAGLIIALIVVIYTVLNYPVISPDMINTLISINNPLFIILITGVTYAVSFFLFYLFVRFLHHKNFKMLVNYGVGFRWRMLLKGGFIWFVILSLLSFPDFLLNPGAYQVSLNFEAFYLLLGLSALVFPVQASFEELLFRGYLMQGISLISERPIIPLLLTSTLFGLVHFFNGANLDQSLSIVVSTFLIGLMLGIIALADNGLETAMGVHIVNNLFVALIFNSADSGLPGLPSLITAPASNPFTGIPFLILAVILMLVVLYWNQMRKLGEIFGAK
ncbi:CPBP family intramembrane metalloprotease [Methanobacterium sp. CWC-01]|uniref:CPBP family intramembrane glutamic endopeptidase n=1 Tax=Methanobacterium aridiramus TaxID=2584467 RepID=UPI002577A126|nr:type II CAAX endopeptidase family protein [Methanobacterium sp. CWC-01]WJI09737.1 CPBP family intramembrane metalloprotease [Methanobacterium sp. CWC-01]